MRLNMYAVLDTQVQAYLQPFFMRTDNEAIRAIAQVSLQKDHQFCQHPSHFGLFRLGTFDDATGLVDPEAQPMLVGDVLSCRKAMALTAENDNGEDNA